MAEPAHPRLPLTLNATGDIITVPQNSLAEVRQCAHAILRTPLRSRVENLELGRRDPRWKDRPDVDAIQDALDQWEPRAVWELVPSATRNGQATIRITSTNV
jgi:phage baseplate assembly protein W